MERGNSKFAKKEDFLWYLIFVGGIIVVRLALCLIALFPLALNPSYYVPHISARIVSYSYYYNGSWN